MSRGSRWLILLLLIAAVAIGLLGWLVGSGALGGLLAALLASWGGLRLRSKRGGPVDAGLLDGVREVAWRERDETNRTAAEVGAAINNTAADAATGKDRSAVAVRLRKLLGATPADLDLPGAPDDYVPPTHTDSDRPGP